MAEQAGTTSPEDYKKALEEIDRLKAYLEESESAKHQTKDELNEALAEMEALKSTLLSYEAQI